MQQETDTKIKLLQQLSTKRRRACHELVAMKK